MQFRREYLKKRFGQVTDQAGDRDRDIQNRPEGSNLGRLERADEPVSGLEKGCSEVDAEARPGSEVGNRRDASSLQPDGHHDLAVDAKGALEPPKLTQDHAGRQDLSGDQRYHLEQLQSGGRTEKASVIRHCKTIETTNPTR
jgi:hypothetical protein